MTSTDLTTPQITQQITHRSAELDQLVRDQFGLHEASASEIDYFFAVANQLNLNPVTKQIYAIMRYDGRLKRSKLTVQLGIDGMRATAARGRDYAGSDDPVYRGTVHLDGGRVAPETATVTVWKLVQGHRVPFTSTAHWEEFYPGDKQGAMWRKMPRVMLAKVAEAQALRKGWPEALGQVYTDEEMHQADADVPLLLTTEQVETIGMLASTARQPAAAWKARAATKPAAEWDATLHAAVAAAADATGLTTEHIHSLIESNPVEDLPQVILAAADSIEGVATHTSSTTSGDSSDAGAAA